MRSTRVLTAIVLVGAVAAQGNQATTATTTAATTSSTSSSSSSSTSTSTSAVAITGGQTAATSAGNLPAVGQTGLPTLSKTKDAIPTYPPPAVPPTSQAPFMQRSNLPQGTVFIAVGAILGAFGLTVLVWRAIIACLLHRDVERAAAAQHTANDKAASFPAPPAPFYKSYNDSGSNPNLLSNNTGLGGAAHPTALGSSASLGKGVRRTNRGPTPSATPSHSNLFFSPTAASGVGGTQGSSNRDSRFLPSGFYAAGGGQPSPIGARHEHSISLSNLRPDSRGHARAVTPPESPQYGPGRHSPSRTSPGRQSPLSNLPPQHRNVSTSTLNQPNQGRAPSAYLEDMLDDPNSQLHHLPGGVHGSQPQGGRF